MSPALGRMTAMLCYAQPAPHLPVPKLPPTPAPTDPPSHAPPTRWPTSPPPCPSESVNRDLRQEMDVHARLAAAEAVQRVGGRGAAITHTEHCEFVLFSGDVRWAPVILLPNAGSRECLPDVRMPADMSVIHPARPSAPICPDCGPLSILIGLFLLPCICFCPVRLRDVRACAWSGCLGGTIACMSPCLWPAIQRPAAPHAGTLATAPASLLLQVDTRTVTVVA